MKNDKNHHFYDFEVSFDFIDAGGVVYHPYYYILLERARFDFCKKNGIDLVKHFDNGFVFVVAELKGKYRLPLKFANHFYIASFIDKVTTRSMVVRQYIISKDNLEKARECIHDSYKLSKVSNFSGEIHLVHVDMNQMKTVPIPENFVSTFKELQ